MSTRTDLLAEREQYTRDRVARITAAIAAVFGDEAPVVVQLRDILDELRECARLRGRDE